MEEFLKKSYAKERITPNEIFGIVRDLEKLPASDLYETKKTIMHGVRDGFLLKRENRKQKDLYITLIDYVHPENNIFKLGIQGFKKRIPDGVNTKAGSFFAPYEFFYSWRKIEGFDKEIDPKTGKSTQVHGINAMYTLVKGMLDKRRLLDIIHNFIYLPDWICYKKMDNILRSVVN